MPTILKDELFTEIINALNGAGAYDLAAALKASETTDEAYIFTREGLLADIKAELQITHADFTPAQLESRADTIYDDICGMEVAEQMKRTARRELRASLAAIGNHPWPCRHATVHGCTDRECNAPAAPQVHDDLPTVRPALRVVDHPSGSLHHMPDYRREE